jgi:hypothetical protein
MKSHQIIIAAGFALFAFAAYALPGVTNVPVHASLAKGDRLDVMEQAQRCAGSSMMAACADDAAADAAFGRGGSFIQVFEQPGTTILVRSKVGS